MICILIQSNNIRKVLINLMSHRLKYVKVNEIEDLVVNNKEMIGVNIYFV